MHETEYLWTDTQSDWITQMIFEMNIKYVFKVNNLDKVWYKSYISYCSYYQRYEFECSFYITYFEQTIAGTVLKGIY